MSDVHIIAILIVILFSAWISLHLTNDPLNPVFVFIVCIYVNFTLSFVKLSSLQYSPQNIDKNFLSIYYFSGLSFIIFPLIFYPRVQNVTIRIYELINYNSFAKMQFYVLGLYALLIFISNYILSGRLISIFEFDLFSYGRSLHTQHVPVLTTLLIPFLGDMVFFEGLFYKRQASAIFRICLFLFLPLLRGNRLIVFDLFVLFFIGVIISKKSKFQRSKNEMLKTLFYSVLLFVPAYSVLYIVGLIRSKYFYYNLSWSKYWDIYLTGISFIDEIIAFYWRYFVMTFDNFELVILSVKPRGAFFAVFLYPLIALLQLDNVMNFELIQETLRGKFLNSIENVTQVIGFFGPIYVVGGFGITILFISIFSIVLNSIYRLGVTKSRFSMAVFVAMTNCLAIGSFTNSYIGLAFIIHILSICFGFRLYQNAIQITKVGIVPTGSVKHFDHNS